MYQKVNPERSKYHDNMFCHKSEETIAFLQDVKVPCIAFKAVAAGAIPPAEGFRYAFQGGADFICVGMFDFQVTEDAIIARRAMEEARNRKRPWY